MNKNTTLAISLLLLLSACSDQEQTITVVKTKPKPVLDVLGVNDQTNQASLDDLINRGSKEFFQFKPQFASLTGVNESEIGFYYQDKLDTYQATSIQNFRQQMQKVSNQLIQLENSEEQIDEDNRVIMANLFQHYAGHPEFQTGFIDSYMGHQPFIINQINGPLIDTVFTFTDGKTIENLSDAKDYAQRVALLSTQINQVNQKFIHDANQGWMPPKAIFTSTISYFDTLIATKPEELLIYSHLKDSLAKLPNIKQQDKNNLLASVSDDLKSQVLPAYKKVKDSLVKYIDKAPNGDGIWAQKNGDKFYQYSIKQQGDTRLSAEEIHQLGLKEVSRISAEMNSILEHLNYTEGSISQRINALAKELRFSYPATEAGREQIISDLNQQILDINKKMPSQFNTAINYQVMVKAFPKETEQSAAFGQYLPPPFDGSKPGVFWINLRDIENIAKFDLPTLTFHETNPGHHWQVSLNMGIDELPIIRKLAVYNAYIEGWALYAEQVAYEMGVYDNDPYSNLGRLKAEIFRAVRLVVDTGIHHKKWSREQAIDYMMANTGAPYSEVKAEIERYMVWPGQALGYKLGMLKILDLRKQSKRLLGERFDIGEFHDAVLLNGAVPMAVLEQKVNDWVASK
ncbi:DUF885 domain-containing protein [Thalassotalea crassostreae]|uniref:DUF885 domain-containing protein n=1 Tax=Thalassotalea crassostreae TaxID=1763536 RepID=UPI0008397D6F|nr:DUF885 domain-containing protein [Thalassotalea crassostreae]